MATVAKEAAGRTAGLPEEGRLARALENKTLLVVLCMTPAAGPLLLFLTYPLGLGIWLGFTDTRIGRAGSFIELEPYWSLFHDRFFWMTVNNPMLVTVVAPVGSFSPGLCLWVILTHPMPL